MASVLIIFLVSYIAIASEKFERHWVALMGGAILVVSGAMSFSEAMSFINWETLGLLAGMFFLVSILQEGGFFSWLAMRALKWVNFRPEALFIILILFAATFSMFLDSITVMLFLSALTIQLCRLINLDPIPIIIAEVCAANTGGAATLVGDPPNVILGTSLGFSFMDFVTHTGPISLIGIFILLGIFFVKNRKALLTARNAVTPDVIAQIETVHQEPVHVHLLRVGLPGFFAAVFLLIFHGPITASTGIPLNVAVAALIPAGFALIALRDDQRKKAFLKVDGESILFFAGLFVLIGGLEKVGLFEGFAKALAGLANSNSNVLIMVLHWVPGLLSGVLDNVPLALAMSYVLKGLAAIQGMPALGLMTWSLALGVDIGGNLTPIGATANVVAYTYTERHYKSIGWGTWIATAVPATLVLMAVATVLLLWKNSIGWH